MLDPIVPACDPKAGYLALRAEIDEAIQRTLASGSYILGSEVTAFEAEFARFAQAKHALGVGNGTDALELALRACGIGPGDAVFTVSHTAVATVAAIELVGATPVFVDIDPATYTMCPARLAQTLEHMPRSGARPKAVLPVHLYGQAADMPGICAVAERNALLVIEDCCQAHGATLACKGVGTWGRAAAYSFYPTKNLGALGDGGAVTTDDQTLADHLKTLREYGWEQRYVSQRPGMNSRLDELQAAILRVKLQHLPANNKARQDIAALYLRECGALALGLPQTRPGAGHVYHQFVVRHPRRDDLRQLLSKRGVQTLIHYPVPVHMQPAYSRRIPLVLPLPETETAASQILSLPIYPEMGLDNARHVASALIDALAQG